MPLLEKNQTGLASEFYVAGELSRLGYNVTITFGNTKSIDLLVQKGTEVCKIQVKGMQSTKSICWNLDKTKLTHELFIVLVNLHVDNRDKKPEFFILTSAEARIEFRDTPKQGEKRTWLDYNSVAGSQFQNRWEILGLPGNQYSADRISVQGDEGENKF
jgi:hypothetical protein